MLNWPKMVLKVIDHQLPRAALRVWQRRLAYGGHAAMGFAGMCLSACGAGGHERELALKFDPIVHGQPLKGRPAKPVTHFIVLGDSISSGMGAESKDLSYAALLRENDDSFYPEERGRDLQHRFGDDLVYINLAHHGDNTFDVVANQLPQLEDRLTQDAQERLHGIKQVDGSWQIPGRVVLVMTVGGNDVQDALKPHPNFTGPVLASSLTNISHILDFFDDKNRFPGGVSTYFGNVYDVTDGEDQLNSCMAGMAFPGMAQALDVWSEAYGELAQTRSSSTLVDLLGLFRGHGFNFANPRNPYFDPHDTTLWVYDRDCIHPNNRGHNMLRRAFLDTIAADFAPTAALAH